MKSVLIYLCGGILGGYLSYKYNFSMLSWQWWLLMIPLCYGIVRFFHWSLPDREQGRIEK